MSFSYVEAIRDAQVLGMLLPSLMAAVAWRLVCYVSLWAGRDQAGRLLMMDSMVRWQSLSGGRTPVLRGSLHSSLSLWFHLINDKFTLHSACDALSACCLVLRPSSCLGCFS